MTRGTTGPGIITTTLTVIIPTGVVIITAGIPTTWARSTTAVRETCGAAAVRRPLGRAPAAVLSAAPAPPAFRPFPAARPPRVPLPSPGAHRLRGARPPRAVRLLSPAPPAACVRLPAAAITAHPAVRAPHQEAACVRLPGVPAAGLTPAAAVPAHRPVAAPILQVAPAVPIRAEAVIPVTLPVAIPPVAIPPAAVPVPAVTVNRLCV